MLFWRLFWPKVKNSPRFCTWSFANDQVEIWTWAMDGEMTNEAAEVIQLPGGYQPVFLCHQTLPQPTDVGFAVANSVENTCFQSQETAHTRSVVLRDFTALLEILIPERHPVRNMGEDLFALHPETPVGSLISRLVPSELSLLLLARASRPL